VQLGRRLESSEGKNGLHLDRHISKSDWFRNPSASHMLVHEVRERYNGVAIKNLVAYERADFCPDLESSATVGLVGFAWVGASGLLGLLPLPEPAAPPLFIKTIMP
jgi:hypothetical protein